MHRRDCGDFGATRPETGRESRAGAAIALVPITATATVSLGGLSIAGLLSVPLCRSVNCMNVEVDPRASFAGIPFAFWGLTAYAVVFATCCLRLYPRTAAAAFAVGYMFSAVGTTASVLLQFYAAFGIGEVCPYCVASAAAMCILLTLHAFAASAKCLPPPRYPSTLLLVLYLLSASFVVGNLYTQFERWHAQQARLVDRRLLSATPVEALDTQDSSRMGDPKSSTTLVAFLDMNCGPCSRAFESLVHIAQSGSAVVVVRHHPLVTGGISHKAAVLAEASRSRGMFLPFVRRWHI
jgi:uncharacterized membrane protein